jgi:Flp pilus assembly protein TadG
MTRRDSAATNSKQLRPAPDRTTVRNMRSRLTRNERGAALVEAAITIPLMMLLSVAIFEFGRAYQTWQVLTNAAREGARIAVLAGTTDAEVRTAVNTYMSVGQIRTVADANILVNRQAPLGTNTGSQITVRYPFSFMVLGPVLKLINPSSTAGAPLTMSAVAVMRNE